MCAGGNKAGSESCREGTRPPAVVHCAANEHDTTRRALITSLSFLRSLPPSVDRTQCLLGLSWVALGEGYEIEAEAHLREAAPLVEEIQELVPDYLRVAGAISLIKGSFNRAREKFLRIHKIPTAAPSTQAYAWEGLAMISAREGSREKALLLSARAATLRAKRTSETSPWWRYKFEAAMTEIKEKSPDSGGRASPTARDSPEKEPTVREKSVAALVACGMSNRQIARRLKISERTVESHLANLRAKLHLQSRAQVAIWAAGQVVPPG